MSPALGDCRGGLGCPSWFVLLFLCLFVLPLCWGWGGWSQVCGSSCNSWVLDSYDARLRRPDTFASGRTLSFCRRGFLPWAFLRTWVSRPRPCLGSYLLWCSPSLVLGFAWRLAVWWSRHLLFSWILPWVLPSRFQCWLLLAVVEVYLWLSSLRSFAVEVVTRVVCLVLVGLPSWRCCASGLLGPVVFLVFMLGHLSQVRSVLPPDDAVGFGLRWSARLSCLLTGRC